MTQMHVEKPRRTDHGNPPGPGRAAAASPDAALDAATELFDELKVRLDVSVASVKPIMDASATEIEIGQLFARAQSFIDRSVAQAHEQAAQILAEARAKADAIVAEARQPATEVVDDAPRYQAILPEALQQLEKTINSFSRTNSELTHELSQLRSSLAPQPGSHVHARPTAMIEPPTASVQRNWVLREAPLSARRH